MDTEPETKVLEAKTPSTTTKPPSESAAAPQRVVGRYELIHRLGHGGMATVFLGRATGTAGFEKLVAVKVIHPHLANEPEFVEMFLDEARIAAHIRHPHVVEIHDLGDSAEGTFYMVMEFVEGATLSALLRQLRNRDRTLPIPVVLQIMADACEGLAAAHELCDRDGKPYGLVHRDVSPQNFLVSMSGWVKLVDFGIMKAAGKRSTTLTGQLRGKLPYMSPEQAHSMPVDHRTDLFALGAVLWELLTNERLFAGGSEVAVLEKVTQCELPDVFEKRRDLPRSFDKLLRKTLSRNPDERYESAREMLADVKLMQREVAAEGDPRRQLAALMHEHFSSQVEYARAAVRGTPDGSGELDLHLSPDQSISSGVPDSARGRGLASPTTPARVPPGVPAATNTHTLSSSLGTAPTRHWAMWIVLPLIGAAIGTAVMALDREGRPQGEVVDSPAPPPPIAEDEQPAEIVWTFNTQPQGATVVIGDTRYPDPTPTEVTMPRGDQVVRVRFEKDGYVAGSVQLRPTRTENVPIVRLEPTPPPTSAHGVPPRLSAPTKAAAKRKKPASRPKTPLPSGSEGAKHKGKKTKPPPDFDKFGPGGD